MSLNFKPDKAGLRKLEKEVSRNLKKRHGTEVDGKSIDKAARTFTKDVEENLRRLQSPRPAGCL